jgi:hypothetical protein
MTGAELERKVLKTNSDVAESIQEIELSGRRRHERADSAGLNARVS